MAENKTKSLYDTFVNEGYDMESEADFRKNLADATKRKSVYDALVNDGYDMEDYADFEKNLGFGTIESQSINDIATEQGWGKSAMPIEEMPTPHPQPHPDSTIAQVRKEAEEEKQAKIDALPTPDTDKIVAGIKGFTTPSQNAYQQKMDEVDEINKAEKFGAITPQEADVKRKSLMIGDALSMANKPSDASMRRVNAEQVVKRLDDIEKSLKKRKDEVAFSSLDKYGDNAAYMMSTYSPIVERRSDREYNTLLAARRALSDAQTIIDEADRNINPEDYSKWQKNWVSGLGRGVGEKLFDVRTWDMGVNEMSDASVLYQALDKADKGEKLTEAEEALLEAKALEMATNAYFGSYLGRAYKAGQVTAQSVPFMLEMAISPLSAVGKTAQSKLVRYALKEFGGKAINNKLKKTALKYGTRLAGDLAGATGMTLSSSMPRTAADAFGRMSGNITPSFDDRGVASYGGHEGQVNAGKAMRQAVTAGTLERFSEMMGYYFAPMSKVVGKGATKMMDAPKLAKVNDFLGKVSSTDLARGMKDFQRATHWDGSISEYLEEFANNHLNALLVGDMEFNTGDKGVYNLDSNIDTFLGVSVLGGGMSAIATGYYPVYKYRQQRALVNADRNAGRAFGGDWDGIKSQLSKIDDSIKQPIADIIQSEDYTPEQKKAALQYVKAKATLKGVQEADVNKLMDVEIPTEKKEIAASYDVGRSVSTPEEKNEAKRNLDEARNALLTHFGMSIDEDVDALLGDNAIEDVLNSLEIGGSMQEAQLKLDYLNAKATFDGMIDNVRDNVKDEINESNRLIDSRTNKENNSVQPAKIGTEKENRDVFIVAGNVVLMDDGKTINRDLSSKDIVVMDKETGKLEMTTADRLFEVQPSLDANEVKTQAAREIQARITTKEGDEIDGILPFANGDVYTIMDESGAVHQASIMNNNGDGTAIVSIDGAEAVNMPTESVQAMADAFKDTQRAERKVQQAQAEQEQFAEAEKEINATPATSSIPVDENGNRQYTQVDADTAWDGLMEQTEGDADMAMIVANSMKEKAEKALEDVKKEKVADGNTPEEMISAMKAHKEAVAQAQAEVDKWNDIATTPQRRAEQARLDAEKEANAAKMQAIINDAVEKKAEQEQTETTPETQEQVAQNEGEAQNNVEEVAEPAPQKPSLKEAKKAKALIKRIKDWAKVLNVDAVIYHSVEEVESPQARKNIEEGKLVTGWYENGKIYFYLPNLRDVSDVNYTAIHETVAHHGMEAMLGKEAYRDLCKRIYDEVMTDAQRKEFLDYVRKNEPVKGGATEGKATYEEKIAIGDEFMAFLAEQTYVEHSSAYDKIAAFVRKALRAVGFDVKLSGEELRDLLRQSYQNLESGKAEATTGEHRARVVAAETNPYLGRSLTSQEAKAVVSLMENNAQPAPTLELTPDNWVAEFGEDGIVATPIGDVKMGEGQYFKMAQKGREGKLGMIKPTLQTPDVIIEEASSAKDGKAERNSSYVFVKAFTNEDGSRNYLFTSVTIRKEGKEVVISNQEKETPRIERLLKEGKLAYISEATLPSESTNSTQGNQSTILGGAILSASKDTTSEPQMQEKAEENVESIEKNIEEVTESANRIKEEGGQVDVDRGDVRFAVRDVLIGERKEQAVKDIMRVTGRSRKTVLKYLKAEESLANIILNGDNEQFLDLQVDESVPSIWNNSDYPQGTVEFSNICRKRLPLTMIYQQLQKEFPNTVFDAATLETIRATLKENGIDVACGLCFVEDRRQLLGEIGQGFIDALEGKEVDLNTTQKEVIAQLNESGNTYVPNLYELLTLDGMKELRRNHPEVANAFIRYNGARGMQAGRLFQAYSAYHREILGYDQKRVEKINNSGGLRIFSFSDFEAHHLIDLVQVLSDCAAKGIKVQGYTKVPEFAYAVKDTKMKLNRSLIAKDSGIVDADYVPQQGEAVSPNVIDGKRLLLDTVEGIDVNHKDFFDSSSSKNVGNILVGINDEQIRLAMADPFVDYIIPFHSGLSEAIRKQKGIGEWTNYKLTQLEKKYNEKGKLVNADKHGINIYTEVLSDDIKTEKQFVEKYLEVCKEKGWIPKFHQFLNTNKDGEFVYTKGYAKLLIDYKLFDKKGRILPQEVVEPIFDNEFNKQILEDYVAGEKAKTPNAEVYEQVKEALQEEGKIQFRVRDNKEIEQIVAEAKANGTYLKAPNGADTNLTPKQWAMVRTKAFKNWFGDWGKTARIEKLRSSKDAVITGEEIEASDDLKQYRKNAHVYGRTLQGQYTNADTGSVISLQRGRHNGGINEVLQHNYKDVAHLQSVAAIPQIIENGIYIESQPNRDVETNPNVSEYQMFVCGLNIGGEDYTVLAKVAVDKNGNRYYDHNLVSVEKGKLIDIANNNQSAKSSGFGTTPDTKSTTNSLYKFNEIISILQINSSKIVDANGEPKVVYHQTNATQYINVETGENWDDLDWRAKMEWDERDDWDEYWQEQDFNEFSRVNARVTNEFDGFFFAPEYDEFHEYGKRTIEAFLNIRKPASRGDYNIDSTKNEAGRDERIRLQNEGYDGVIREYDGVVDEYIAFEPNQIKSATDNVGTFDAGNNDIRFRIADYKAEFNNLQSEYDALDKNDAVALNAWRDKKVGVVRGYLESVANRFGMKPEIIVFNGADEAQMQEAYQRLVESYKRTGNTPPTYDAFRLSSLNKEIFALYYIEADVIVNNISTKDNFNKENRYAKNLFHENAHHHIRDTFKYAELEALWNEIASSDIQLVQEINTSPIYKNENNSTKGNEFIAHSIAIIATKHKELFIQFVKGKDGVTADNVVEKLNYQKQTTNFAIAKILNLIRDEYQEARHRSGVVARAEEGGDNNLSRPSRRGNRRKRDNKRGVLVTPEQKAFYNAVAQNGLREVVGKDNYQEFLFDVFQQVDDQTRRTIVDSAMANGYDFLTATEQYFASLAKNNNQEQGFFDKLRSLFLEMLRKVRINIGNELADNDLLYMMWRTYQKPRSKGAMGVAEDVAMREELGVGNYEVADQIPSSPKFRIATPSTGEAKRYYNNAVRRSTKTNSLKSTDNLAHKLKEAYFDSMLSVKELMEGIRRETGAPFIKDNADVYSAENRLSSTNKSQVEAWERDQFAPMMKAVTDLINKGASYDDIKEYIVAKHGLERNLVFSKKEAEKNGGQWDGSVKRDFSGLTELTGEATQFTDAAQQIVDEFEAKYNTAELWSKINAATKATLQKSFYSGMMDKETYDNLRTMFKHYVPLRGWANHAAASEYEYMGSSNMKILPTLKTAKGRTSLAEDPLATIGAMGESAIIQGNRNLMKQKLLTLALDYPTSLLTVSEQWYVKEANGKWRPESPYIPEGATGEQVADILKQFEEDMELLGEDAKKQRNGLELNLHTTTAEGEEHSVRVKRNGKEYIVYVNGNPTAAQAINGFTNPNTRTKEDWVATLMDGADKVKNFMARSFTSYNPAFVISNFARDIIFAGTAVSIKEDGSYTWQYTKNIGSFIGTATLPRLVSKWENGTLDTNIPIERMFKEFMLNGGETGYTQLNSVDEYKKQMQRLIKEAQGGAVANTKKFFRSGLDLVEFANRSVEDTTRFAVYMTSRQQGRTIAQSVADAKNITVNFNKKGRGNMGAGAFSYLYIFFNAAMQSLSNMGKLIKEHPVKSGPWLSAYGSAGFLCPFITVALQSLFGDDDESNYWDLPEWIRRNNIVLPIPFTDGYFTIPLPHELRPFYGVGEIAFSVMMGKEEVEEGLKKAIEGFAGMMPIDPTGNAGDLVTNLTPTVAQPIVQILRNRDYFGIPIYKDTPFNKYAPEWTKAYKGTSALLVDGTKAWNELWGGDKVKSSAINEKGEIKALGWLTDINPAIVEYLFESYLGGMGKTFSQTYKTIEMLWNEDTRTMRNIPIVGNFLRFPDERNNSGEVNTHYFDAINEARETERLVSGYRKEANLGSEEYAKILAEFMESPLYKRYEVMKPHIKAVNLLNNTLKDADSTNEESIKQAIYDTKKFMLEELDKFETNGYQPLQSDDAKSIEQQ